MSNNKTPSQGIEVFVRNAADTAYLKIGEIQDIAGPTGGVNVKDQTTLDDVARKKGKGIIDWGQYTLTCFYRVDDVGQQRLIELFPLDQEVAFQATYPAPANETRDFNGLVVQAEEGAARDEDVEITFVIEITGDLTRT